MTVAICLLATVAALVAGLRFGGRWAFTWIYVPALLLVPVYITVALPILPDLTPRRGMALGIAVACWLRGARFVPPLAPFDLLPIAAVFSLSISFGLETDAWGFMHKLAVLAMDWLPPYFFARVFFLGRTAGREWLRALAVSATVAAMAAIYEARMQVRVGALLWGILAGYPTPNYWGEGGAWRWGYLRAFFVFVHPIVTGSIFAAMAPLMLLWGQMQSSRKWLSWAAAAACAGGCIASLSRGPMLVLVFVAAIFSLIAVRARALLAGGVLVLVISLPFVVQEAKEDMAYTEDSMVETGNVESEYYRLALLMIYGKQLGEVGWWGKPSIVGAEFEKASSIDNGYLYLFITGGWIGGGLFCCMSGLALTSSMRSTLRSRGALRRQRACVAASVWAMALCMGNVWFAPDFASIYFLVLAFAQNQSRWLPAKRTHGWADPAVADVVSGRGAASLGEKLLGRGAARPFAR